MPERLQQLGYEAAIREAEREEGNGVVRARCLADQLAPAGSLWVAQLSEDEFLSLSWQETDHTRQLTEPPPRSLRSVAQRLLDQYGSFDRLVSAPPICGTPRSRVVRGLRRFGPEFDWDKFGKPWLVPAKASERQGSSETSLYVCEGAHRTLVAAVGLLSRTVTWKPMMAIEAEERLEGCC